jgi:hypothetical protein
MTSGSGSRRRRPEQVIAKPIFSSNRLVMVDFLDRKEKQRITVKPILSRR